MKGGFVLRRRAGLWRGVGFCGAMWRVKWGGMGNGLGGNRAFSCRFVQEGGRGIEAVWRLAIEAD
jgi:hypothetical protein